MFSGKLVKSSAGSPDEDCRRLKKALSACDADIGEVLVLLNTKKPE